MKKLNLAMVVAGATALSACGYQPLYTQTAEDIAAVHVASVEMILDETRGAGLRRPAQLINQKLKQTFTAAEGAGYTLTVKLQEEKETLAVRSDGVDSRVRLTLNAFVTLKEDGKTVFSTKAEARAPYNVEDTPYSTDSGIENARKSVSETLSDEIMHRVTFFLGSRK